MALSVAYGAGLRVSEVCALKVSDVDSQRMALRIEQGKDSKDRHAMRRFLLHVLPDGFHRIRHYGLIANGERRENLARTRELLHVAPVVEIPDSTETTGESVQSTFVCPHCGAAMLIIETLARIQPIRAPPRLRGSP